MTINETILRGKKLIFGDSASIKARDIATKEYQKLKRSGLTEEQYYWKKELEYWGDFNH